MNILFGILLIICAIIYSFRVAMYIWVVINKKRLATLLETSDMTVLGLYLGAIEHLLYMVALIGSAALLLSY